MKVLYFHLYLSSKINVLNSNIDEIYDFYFSLVLFPCTCISSFRLMPFDLCLSTYAFRLMPFDLCLSTYAFRLMPFDLCLSTYAYKFGISLLCSNTYYSNTIV